jgi:OHCU decarboxylase
MTLDDLNDLDPLATKEAFTLCCGSLRWATAMAASRPFESLDAMVRRGDEIWTSLSRADWLDAFAAHPKIGEQRPVTAWSATEQAGMSSAGDGTRDRLAELNQAYEARFGYIFIVSATGKPASEMLALLVERLAHDPGSELAIAAGEQRRITALRLAKLLDAHE